MSICTIYKDVKETKDGKYIAVEKALLRIKEGNSKAKVYLIQGQKSKAEKTKIKATLPSVCFSGKFSERKDNCLLEHSGFVVLDFDHLKNLTQKKKEICEDEYTYACWVSPSGEGLKVLVQIPKEKENHEAYYLALIDKYPELDSTSKNLSRVCYESFDSEIYINKDSKVWTTKKESTIKLQASQPIGRAIVNNYSKAERALQLIRNSVDGQKHIELLKASKLMGGYIAGGLINETEAVRLLEQEIQNKGVDSFTDAQTTIHKGIDYGKATPIVEQENYIPIKKIGEKINQNNLLGTIESESSWLKLAETNSIPQGYDIGSKHFDDHFRLKPRTIVGIFGIDGVGKTTFHNFLSTCYSKKHKEVNWLLIVRENDGASVRQNLIELFSGKAMHDCNEQEKKEAKDFAYNQFDIIENNVDINIDNFFEILRLLYSKKHYLITFVDPYNAIQYEQTPNKNYSFIGQLRAFQNEFNMSFHLSMHIATERARNYVYSNKETLFTFDGQEIGLGGQMKIPRKNFVEGGQPIANKLDDIIIVHRIPKLPEIRSYILISIDKVKEEKTGGMVSFEEPILFLKRGKHNTFVDKYLINPLLPINTIQQSIIIPNKEFDSELTDDEERDLWAAEVKNKAPF